MEEKNTSVDTIEKARGSTCLSDPLTETQRQLQRKVKWKLDLLILPLLSTIYFFASMVRGDPCLSPAHPGTDICRVDLTLAMLRSWEWTLNSDCPRVNMQTLRASSTLATWCSICPRQCWFERSGLHTRYNVALQIHRTETNGDSVWCSHDCLGSGDSMHCRRTQLLFAHGHPSLRWCL